MRLYLVILSFLFVSFSSSQGFDWSFTNTGNNGTIAISGADYANITFNGTSLSDGDLIGVFYINDSGDYMCAGYEFWDTSAASIAVTVWGTEAGMDNGLAIGEAYNWFVQIGGETYGPDSNGATMNLTPPFSDTYSLNAFGQLLSVNFIGAVGGCTDPIACNYDDTASVDDGSCIFSDGITDCDGNCLVGLDCNNVCGGAAFIDSCGDCVYEDLTAYYDCSGNCFNDVDGDGVCDELEVFGCTDFTSVNYDPLATEDDGSCDCIGGCTNPSAANFDPSACFDDGSCNFIIFGCMDLSALNYDPNATIENGLCCYIAGCTDPLYLEYNPLACFDDGSCSVIPGCTDDGGVDGIIACNYNPDANFDDGSCDYSSCAGCMDPGAVNYDASATIDDGSCTDQLIGCGDPQADNYAPFSLAFDNTLCEYLGCTDDTAFNPDPFANVNDGSCCYTAGCTDFVALNFNPFACFDDDSCDYLYGCMDPDYVEFDPFATFDDGSCFTFIIYGCTDPIAGNYDDFATVDDGSCISPVLIDLIEVCQPICEDDLGFVAFELSGGIPPYSFYSNNLDIDFCYLFNGCEESNCFSIDNNEYFIEDLNPGFHSFMVSDQIGYTLEVSFTIVEPDDLFPYIWEDGNGLSTFENPNWSYQWFLNGTFLSNENNFNISPSTQGLYSLEVVDENGCVGLYEYNFTSSLVDSYSQNIILYPNPSYSTIYLENIDFNNSAISICDNIGRELIVLNNLSSNKLEISIEDLKDGLYHLNILNSDGVYKTTTFIKSKY